MHVLIQTHIIYFYMYIILAAEKSFSLFVFPRFCLSRNYTYYFLNNNNTYILYNMFFEDYNERTNHSIFTCILFFSFSLKNFDFLSYVLVRVAFYYIFPLSAVVF